MSTTKNSLKDLDQALLLIENNIIKIHGRRLIPFIREKEEEERLEGSRSEPDRGTDPLGMLLHVRGI